MAAGRTWKLAAALWICLAATAHADLSAELDRCAAISNAVERLACYDSLSFSRSTSALSAATDGSHKVDRWEVRSQTSPIDGGINVYMQVQADGEIDGSTNTYTPLLIFRCQHNTTSGFIVVGMSSFVDRTGEGGKQYSNATLRLDQDPPVSEYLVISRDTRALFFPNAIKFAKSLFSHQTLVFQFTPVDAPPALASFRIAGVAEAMRPLREACGW